MLPIIDSFMIQSHSEESNKFPYALSTYFVYFHLKWSGWALTVRPQGRKQTNRIDNRAGELRQAVEEYFRRIVSKEPQKGRGERLAWRLSCFDTGLRYVRFLKDEYFDVVGKRVLDPACAWGGHALAFAASGARVYAGDILDHKYSMLGKFSQENNLDLCPFLSDCEVLPFGDQTFDIIVALELVEHVNSIGNFASEVKRLLRKGGICLLSTPPRLRSFLQGEPHYGLRGITMLPLSLQRLVATKIFKRSYPYPIIRQYSMASQVIQPFAALGLEGKPILIKRGSRILKRNRFLQGLASELIWNFVVITKPRA